MIFEFRVELAIDAPIILACEWPNMVRRYVRVEAENLTEACRLIDELGDEVFQNDAVSCGSLSIEPVEPWGPEDSRRRAVRVRQPIDMEVTR